MNTIRARQTKVIFQSDSYKVAVFRTVEGYEKKSFTACGNLPNLLKQEEVVLTGEFKANGKFGVQFHVDSWKRHIPTSKEQLITFFSSTLFKGVGKKMAGKIVKSLGKNAINKIVKEGVSCLENVEGLQASTARKIVEIVQQNFVLNDLIEQYHRLNIPSEIIIKAYASFGQKVVELQENPYLLAEINLIHFDLADDIGMEMGISPFDNRRFSTAIKLTLKECIINQGHCYIEEREFIRSCIWLLNKRKQHIEDKVFDGLIIQAMETSKACYLIDDRVYPAHLYFAERDVANAVHQLTCIDGSVESTKVLQAIRAFELKENCILSNKQKEAINELINNNVLILTGGPGTGKTFTVNAILEVYKSLFPNAKISLAAPTGRAAKKLGEVTGMGSHAQTIHRLLGLGYISHDKPLFDDSLHLPYDLIINDEFSMVDIQLASHLFRAIKPGAKVLLVGDPDQLPAVGPGNVLKDLLDAGIPNVKLDKIFRQAESSTIITNAHKINSGEMIDLENKPDHYFIESFSSKRTSELIVNSIIRFMEKGYDLNDILILSPMKKGVLGIDNLNNMIKEQVNPKAPHKEEVSYKKETFRVGDRVMYTRNNKDLDIYNGDLGTIIRVLNKNAMIVEFGKVAVELDKEEWRFLRLAFASTIHKSQGGQAPIVMAVLDDEHSIMLTRNLFYTAMTRTEKVFVLFGSRDAIQKAIETNKVRERKTSLASQLKKLRKYLTAKKNIG